jgi:hypothetical protein
MSEEYHMHKAMEKQAANKGNAYNTPSIKKKEQEGTLQSNTKHKPCLGSHKK